MYIQGKLNTLISTDVCARGLHIKRLQYVVNYDFPGSIEQYCHRIGRVGRQGQYGEAYSLITRNMAPLVPSLISLLRQYNQTVEPNLVRLAEENIPLDAENEEEMGEEEDDEVEDTEV